MADPFGTMGLTNPFPFRSRGLVGTFQGPSIPFAYTTFPHFKTPYSENFNFGFQWQATRDTMVEAVYVGSLGRRLISSGEVTNFFYMKLSVGEGQIKSSSQEVNKLTRSVSN